jgi:hypothetical protein|tara:strand:+ start:997 stop:1146 length:150 start_codon:yes stop_codon:yes gene_type:complete
MAVFQEGFREILALSIENKKVFSHTNIDWIFTKISQNKNNVVNSYLREH